MMFDSLVAGTCTVFLSDGQYIPNDGVGAGSTFGDGFLDLTGGSLCDVADFTGGVQTNCTNNSGNFALDVTINGPAVLTPEPSGLVLLATGLLGLARLRNPRG